MPPRPAGGTLIPVPRLVASIGLIPAFALGCGPGLEAMHESTLRFEHCYRLDMDTRIAPPHREHCWRDWTETYSAGQTLDRVEYARRRLSQLESGDTAVLGIGGAAPPESRVFQELASPAAPAGPIAAPAPTSAHEPPPKTAPAPGDAAKYASPSIRPGQKCTEACDTTLDDCNRLCQNKQTDCTGCAQDYRACMRRCFE
ncbi:MAG TPA: hypothetical protein VHC69_07750 [Polyangiaceae bacterium]|nr:hypothetical protein [Polyangiaceae bacterium]